MQNNSGWASSDSQVPSGVVELREDIPLKSGSGYGGASSRCCNGGPKFIVSCFAALSAGITLALFTQIYYGVEEVVPHGSVSSSSSACSRAGTSILKAGGRAIDAAAATALCLAVLKPHRTGLDASGSLLFWDYRSAHASTPKLYEWGGPESETNETARLPRMIAALATLHSTFGVLPWSWIMQPAVHFARNGFNVSSELASVAALHEEDTMMEVGTNYTNHALADYLEQLHQNNSEDLSSPWNSKSLLRVSPALGSVAGQWKVFVGGPNAKAVRTALKVGLVPPYNDYNKAFLRVVGSLQKASIKGSLMPTGVSSGLAVIDKYDTYVAMVTGLSQPFGSGPATAEGWTEDRPASPIDLSPAIIVDEHVCGTRHVIGAESSSALALAATAILTSDQEPGAVEKPRIAIYPGGVIAIEADKEPPTAMFPAPLVNATVPYAAVNVVQQKGDALLSHADSRGGGIAYRF